jgi:CheY-like chemotaxis protein
VSEKVLLVEDDRAVRRAAKRILLRGGYSVVEAASGEEALQVLAENRFDALVTDIVMPGLQGPDLAEQLTSLCPGVRTLFMSGYSHDVLGVEGGLPARAAFLNKPFSSHQLLTALRRLLDAPA